MVNAAFIIATIIYGFWRARSLTTNDFVLPASVVLFDVALVLIAIWVRRKWLLIGITHTEANQILERCFTQTRAPVTRRDLDYAIKCGEFEMIAGITRNRVAIGNVHLPLPGHTVSFSGAHASQKAKLIRSLFTKQFGGSFPTPRIKA